MNPEEDPNQKKVCFAFVKGGTCKFGDRCHFSHDVPKNAMMRRKKSMDESQSKPSFPPSRNSSTVPCNFFLKGNCKKGQECPFLHSSAPQPGQQPPQSYMKYPPMNTQYQQAQPQQGPGNYQQRNSFQNKVYQKNVKSERNYQMEKPEASSQFLKHVYTEDFLFNLNNARRAHNNSSDFKIPELNVNKVELFGNFIVFLIKGKNFVLVYNLEKKKFLPRQKYLNSEIDESVLDVVIGKFGDIDTDFAAIVYTKFNELNLSMRWINKFWNDFHTEG
jgi:hypothetical protein